MADIIQVRRDTAANWTSANPTLRQGEKGLETDTGKEKTGDGVTAWNSLAYAFVRATGDETIAGVKTFSSSPIVPPADSTGEAVSYGQVKPLSDLNRVFQLNGNGIPTFPDNVAGTVYRGNNFTAIPSGWDANNSPTSTFSGGIWTWSGTAENVGYFKRNQSGLFVAYVNIPEGVTILYGFEGVSQSSLIGNGRWQIISAYSVTAVALTIYVTTPGSIKVSDIYIGSGLYDTPVYGADGKSAWTNHGVVPVPGERGNAMLFQRSQFLEGQQEWGNSGVFAFKYNRKTTGINEYIISDNDFWSNKGKGIFISDGQTLYFIYGNGTTNTVVGLVGSVIADGNHDYVVHFTESTIGPVYRDGVLVYTQTSLSGTIPPSGLPPRIGAGSSVYGGGDRLGGVLSDPRFDTGSWTADDVLRYHNGDDAVDSQQKAITNVPNAIKICDSKGNIRQPGLPVYANNTAALAGGLVAGEPYRTSTGVLMVVF